MNALGALVTEEVDVRRVFTLPDRCRRVVDPRAVNRVLRRRRVDRSDVDDDPPLPVRVRGRFVRDARDRASEHADLGGRQQRRRRLHPREQLACVVLVERIREERVRHCPRRCLGRLHREHLAVRHRAHEVGDRAECTQRCNSLLAFVERPGVNEQRQDDRLADVLLRDERQRRRRAEDVGDQRQLLGRGIRDLDEPGERLRRRGDGEHPAGDRVHRVQPIVEARHDAEVAAAAADRPEQVGLVRLVDVEDAAVGSHDFGSEQMVDRQAVLAHEVAGAAAERETADPDGRRVAEADRKAVLPRPRS